MLCIFFPYLFAIYYNVDHLRKQSFIYPNLFDRGYNEVNLLMPLNFSLELSFSASKRLKQIWHYVKSFHIRSFSASYFPAFELNTERDIPYLPVFSPFAGKYGPEKLRIRALLTQCGIHHA